MGAKDNNVVVEEQQESGDIDGCPLGLGFQTEAWTTKHWALKLVASRIASAADFPIGFYTAIDCDSLIRLNFDSFLNLFFLPEAPGQRKHVHIRCAPSSQEFTRWNTCWPRGVLINLSMPPDITIACSQEDVANMRESEEQRLQVVLHGEGLGDEWDVVSLARRSALQWSAINAYLQMWVYACIVFYVR